MAKAYIHVAISFGERIDRVICENTLREEKKILVSPNVH